MAFIAPKLRIFSFAGTTPVMAHRSSTPRAIGLIAAGLALTATGYTLGILKQRLVKLDQPHNAELAVIAESRERFGKSLYVQDAIRRWTLQNGGTIERAMSGYQVQLIETPSLSCVKFAMIDHGVGGEPTYCYKPRTIRLIWENSDVE